MSWWGKLVTGALGLVRGHPAHVADDTVDQLHVQTAFLNATFALMGRVADAGGHAGVDGDVYAGAAMERLALGTEERRAAMQLFNRGKSPDFDLHAKLAQLRRECHQRSHLLQVFLEIQLQAAYADGHPGVAQRDLLLDACNRLGLNAHDFEHMEAVVRFTRKSAGAETARPASPRDRLRDACRVLNVAPDAGDEDVKRAYRRLISQHHPDKLVARGMPEEKVRLATEKTREITVAYEAIKAARGLR